MSAALKLVGSALLMAGAAALIWCSLQWRQVRETKAKADQFVRFGKRVARPPYGSLVGEVEIPRLGVQAPLLEGDDDAVLARGAGHIPGTALPGQSGNVGIAAHRDSYFRPLRGIREHDEIDVRTPGGSCEQFEVTGTAVVLPSDVGVLRYEPGRDLTLVTCYPFGFIGSAPQRFIVHATRKGMQSYQGRLPVRHCG
jgi:sortase A